MGKARELAIALATKFLESGNYTASAAPMEHGVAMQMMPAAVSDEYRHAAREPAFQGLQIQSVGYAETNHESGSVYIYVTKGSRKAFKDIPDTIEDVQIVIERMGLLSVRPEAANSSTAFGNIFEVNGRIGCGSSCAPSGESGPYFRRSCSDKIAVVLRPFCLRAETPLLILSGVKVWASWPYPTVANLVHAPQHLSLTFETQKASLLSPHNDFTMILAIRRL